MKFYVKIIIIIIRYRIYYKDVHKVVNFIISITNIVFWSLWKEIKVNKNYINLKLSHTTDWLTESKFKTNKQKTGYL